MYKEIALGMLSQVMPAVRYPSLPTELWNEIGSYLSPLSVRAAEDVFRFGTSDARRNHAIVWQRIFRNETWTSIVTSDFAEQLVLVGADLEKLYRNADEAAQNPMSLGLVLRKRYRQFDAREEEGQTDGLWRHSEAFFASLQPHQKLENGLEILLQDSNITLSVASEIFLTPRGRRNLELPDPRKLFTTGPSSAFLCWNDPGYFKSHALGIDHISGNPGEMTVIGLAPRLEAHLFIVRSGLSVRERLYTVGSLSAQSLTKACSTTWSRPRDREPSEPVSRARFRIDADPGFGTNSPDLAHFHWDLLESLMEHIAPIEVQTP